jgi:hypothetical protein
MADALEGKIQITKLSFPANKVYNQQGNETREITGNMGIVFAELANINCELWHEQEKVYEFENVPVEDKNNVVKRLAILNLERNICIDKINNLLSDLCRK